MWRRMATRGRAEYLHGGTAKLFFFLFLYRQMTAMPPKKLKMTRMPRKLIFMTAMPPKKNFYTALLINL
jgi:hypothetical protein